jgi:hypothetical protein
MGCGSSFSSDGRDGGPAVNIGLGKVIGKARETAEGTEYFSFTGIPYAEVPIGAYVLDRELREYKILEVQYLMQSCMVLCV